ncbi:MAG: hypothetical protein U0031_06865 [Thermomicrobiales bacterium]
MGSGSGGVAVAAGGRMGRDGPRGGSSLSATAPTARIAVGSAAGPGHGAGPRCAKNRALGSRSRRHGPARRYGERQPAPTPSWRCARLAAGHLTVQGSKIRSRFVAGPLLVHGAPGQPLFLLVVKGSDPARGKRKQVARFFRCLGRGRWDGDWTLPWPAPTCWPGPGNAGNWRSPTS